MTIAHDRHETPSGYVAAVDRLTVDQVLDLVDELGTDEAIRRPDVAFLPWLEDGTAVRAVYTPGRRLAPARLDIDRRALDDLSPEAWRHLIAHEMAHLQLDHSRVTEFAASWLPRLSDLAFIVGSTTLALRGPSWHLVLIAVLATAVPALLHFVWFLLTEARADRHAIRAAGLIDRPTVDEIYDYLKLQQGSSLADRLLRRHLRRFVDEQLAMRRQIVLSQQKQLAANTRPSDGRINPIQSRSEGSQK